MPGFYRAMAAVVLLLHVVYITWVIFGELFTWGRPRLAVLQSPRCCMELSSKSLDSGARSRRLNSGSRHAAAFPLITELSFCTILKPLCTPIFPRAF